jgi:ribokinase
VPSIRVQPRDTTGAGDAFIGAFAAHYAENRDVEAAIATAVRYAALSITKTGTQSSYADAGEFAAFVEDIGV